MVSKSNAVPKAPQSVVIKEKLTRKILRSVMAQFKSLPEALLELVDNAFDEFDGVRGGRFLEVNIIITKNSIIVENIGGKGMGINELGNWLNWGEVHKRDAIGEYGQGGKAAMGYLGSSWVVQTKRWDEQWLWEIRESKWDDLSSEEKEYRAVAAAHELHKGVGYCKFTIRKLKKHRQDLKRIRAELSSIYRRYLEEEKAVINVNFESVRPLLLPLYDGFKKQEFRYKTSLDFQVNGWIGRLKRDVRVKHEPKIIGGMRLLRKGRLISTGEYFGHPDYRYRASLGTLIGEVELPKIPILPNKTGFHTDSPEWEAAQDTMHNILEPHIKDLLSQKEEENVTREEKKRISQVRNMMIEAFKLLNKRGDLPSGLDEERGRKSAEMRPEEQETSKHLESIKESQEKQPRTPPPEGAIGRLKRLGNMPEWDLRILEPDIRSDWEQTKGRRILLINKKYCLYNERAGDELYIAESAALQLASLQGGEELTVEEYLMNANQIVRAFCEIYSSNA